MADPYGTDLSVTLRAVALLFPDGSTRVVTTWQSDLRQTEVAGRTLLAESLGRRLDTPRGGLIDVVIPSTTAYYGTDIADIINDDMTVRAVAMTSAAVDAEMLKDARVVASATNSTFAAGVLLVPINITDGAGPFPLVLAVGNVTTQILSSP